MRLPILILFTFITSFAHANFRAAPDSKPMVPVLDEELYDISVLNADDGHYYLTGTWIGNETQTPLYKSENLTDWTFVSTIHTSKGTLTAPELYQHDGTFLLLVTENEGTTLYRSTKPSGPYKRHARLGEGIKRASLFFDDSHTYLVYGGGHIAKLSHDLKRIVSPPEWLHPSFDLERPTAYGWATEKAQMLRVGTDSAQIIKENGRYYLLASERLTRLNDVMYDVLCASSESLLGPYTERRLAFMHAGGGTVFKDKSGQYQVAFSGQADDQYVVENKLPIITPAKFIKENTSIAYTGDYYAEKEPIGNIRNRLPHVQVRDPSICKGPDGWYHQVGTENWVDVEFGKPRIMLRRSKDLWNWEDVNHLVDCADLGTQVDGSPLGFKEGERVMMWAPEIQYIKSQNVFMLSVSIPRIPNGGNMQTWIFKGDKPEGPFKNISTGAMHRGIDGFFYEEEDGQVYYLYGANNMTKMNADLTGFDGEFKQLLGLHGIEGMSLVKIDDTYLLARADNTGGPGTATYECIYGTSDNIWGPYDYRGSVPHCGHTTMFAGHDGKWRMTMFGSDSHAPVHHGLGILQFELNKHDRLTVTEDR
ncbi:family 43 glycosylhydrolase [Pelagicoccus mobilis]|uniref:Family 43 glycosylhydrolase n=1 Tax=Pelagicoccus mobilis TaxID=415221 RepID=A0A934S217_9BACT|nr:family 43 glycosylhydrolase [Pelagicoccus mobilis]MBK1879181.1 family 43 glycosylhydrolase [Pelagicoccus mobilis]